MFHRMINAKRDVWYDSPKCSVKDIVDYAIQTGRLRDAQIEAVKTYLFLKIGCANKPLPDLFISGAFNNLDVDDLEVSARIRNYLSGHPAAAALYEYASLKNDDGFPLSEKVVKAIKTMPESIDYEGYFRKAFYDVSYTDYLFSLPMGAGKTFLMAAFIYLDLAMAQNEPENPVFAHNFMVFAPSGLKSSVVPSLRTMRDFNPAWIIPEPSASNLKRLIKFEVLDQGKTASKSNRTKNPNVQKIAVHQPLQDLFGLVAVTNAEKVILDCVKISDINPLLIEESTEDKDRQANELRNLIGKIPGLAVFIDEVHHAATDDKKLRAVVNSWMKNATVNSVVGFSGTPYLEKAEKVSLNDALSVSNKEISNIVYYYPLIQGIGNFLKRPTVRVSNSTNSLEIVEAGIREFFDRYRDTVYTDRLIAKLGIYCGTIEKLEEQIYPLAARIADEYGLNPAEAILKFHRGNKDYSPPVDSQLQFETLDRPISLIRIVLLVQIGKEGWDCRSLTGIILSQEGDCPTNMVLQTSCRCLRQVVRNSTENALIYLNESNAEKLNDQLRQQHHVTIKELENANQAHDVEIKRYNRLEHLKLPKVEFYQLKINYKTLIIDDSLNTEHDIKAAPDAATISTIVKTQDFAEFVSEINGSYFVENGDDVADFNIWLYTICKGSFGFLAPSQLSLHADALKTVFDKVTVIQNGVRYFSSRYKMAELNAAIRRAFYEKRSFESEEELIPQQASLLKVDNFRGSVFSATPEDFYPDSATVEKIVRADAWRSTLTPEDEKAIKILDKLGQTEAAKVIRAKPVPPEAHPMREKSFHYLPYETDSAFEQKFLDEVLKQTCVKALGVEVYYNGDRSLTEFKIKCFKNTGKKCFYVGMYTPDFLIVQRKDGLIYKAIIVETKGGVYASDPTFKDKRFFMEKEFKDKNNAKYGYTRFDYLYLEDTLSENERIVKTANAVQKFFGEDK